MFVLLPVRYLLPVTLAFFVPLIVSAQFIPVPDRVDHVFNSTDRILYITSAQGVVARFDTMECEMLSPWIIKGADLTGIDVTPDGETILVADRSIDVDLSKGSIHRINATTGEVSTSTFDLWVNQPSFAELGSWDVVAGSNSTAFFTTDFLGSAPGRIREWNLANDLIFIRTFLNERTWLFRDHGYTTMLGLESNSSRGTAFSFDLALNDFVGEWESTQFFDDAAGGVDRTGSWLAMELENQDDVLVWDRLLQSVAAQLFDIDGGIHFHPLQDLLFGLDADGDEIVIFSTIDWSELNRIDPHFDLRPTTRFGFGVTSFDSFQDSLFVSVPGGILGVNVTAQEIAPTSADVTRGELVSGDVDDLVLSDNQDLTLRRVTSDIQSRTEVELKVTSPISTVELEVELESSVFARSPVDQTIELFDYTVASWETIDVRPAQPFSDSKVSVVPTGDPSRFIESGTLCLKARVRFNSQNPRQQFSSSIDKFVWAVNEIDD